MDGVFVDKSVCKLKIWPKLLHKKIGIRILPKKWIIACLLLLLYKIFGYVKPQTEYRKTCVIYSALYNNSNNNLQLYKKPNLTKPVVVKCGQGLKS